MMSEVQIERLALGAALLEKDGKLYEYAGRERNGAMVFVSVADGERVSVTESTLRRSNEYHVIS